MARPSAESSHVHDDGDVERKEKDHRSVIDEGPTLPLLEVNDIENRVKKIENQTRPKIEVQLLSYLDVLQGCQSTYLLLLRGNLFLLDSWRAISTAFFDISDHTLSGSFSMTSLNKLMA